MSYVIGQYDRQVQRQCRLSKVPWLGLKYKLFPTENLIFTSNWTMM